jgi:hypothetical protein
MRHAFAGFVALACCAISAAQDGRALKSGPQSGTTLPAPFDALNVTGKVAAGRQHCLVCQNGLSPAVLVFAREPAEGKDQPLQHLMKKIDGLAAKHSDKTLGAFVVFLSPDARNSVQNAVEGGVEDLLKEAKARNDLIARLQARAEGLAHTIVACYPGEGPKDYNVNPKAEVTVVFFERLKVLDNWAFAAGQMTEKDVDAIAARIDGTLTKTKKTGKAK